MTIDNLRLLPEWAEDFFQDEEIVHLVQLKRNECDKHRIELMEVETKFNETLQAFDMLIKARVIDLKRGEA